MTHFTIPALLIIAVTIIGCAPPPAAGPTLAPGVHGGRFAYDGDTLRYRLFVPERRAGDAAPPLLMLLHGCTQDAEDIARGTRLDSVAAAHGMAVLYPEQSPDAHPLRCWNWYLPEHQRRDRGELERLAALADRVAAQIGSDQNRFYAGGISAGAAAALGFAAAYPERVAAVAVHSGLPFGAATDQQQALAAMQRAPERGGPALAELVTGAMGARARPVPLIAFHGLDDAVVHPSNLDALEDQWRHLHARLTGEEPARRTGSEQHGGRVVEIARIGGTDRAPAMETWRVAELGHAWSGGSPGGTYTDPAGPNASREMLRFLLAHTLR